MRKTFMEQVAQSAEVISGRDKEWDAYRSMLEGHSGGILVVVFSPGGKLLASASLDTMRVWETATGYCRIVLEGLSRWVTAVAFSPDGQLLASASRDKTVRVWETATGYCRSELEGWSQISYIVFNSRTLWTDKGTISLPLDLITVSTISHPEELSSIVVKENWIIRHNRPFLWLPPEYRGCAVAIYKHIVCLGCYDGRVTLLSF